VILKVGTVRCIDDRTGSVPGDYNVGKQGSEGHSSRLERKDDQWVVTRRDDAGQ
jgi:hypothetical protein